MRLREFVMKDLYSFDVDMASAQITYNQVGSAYLKIFEKLSIPVNCTMAACGDIGGVVSHEYHLFSNIGEDNIVKCADCNAIYNVELSKNEAVCNNCDASNVRQFRGLELGHTFLLGSHYSKIFAACIKNEAGEKIPLQMGCFGIGVSRIISAIAETRSDQYGIVWPSSVAPFQIIIMGTEARHLDSISLQKLSAFRIAVDDRYHMSLSWRLKDARLLGVPLVMVIGADSVSRGTIELYHRTNEDFVRSDLNLTDSYSKVNAFLK